MLAWHSPCCEQFNYKSDNTGVHGAAKCAKAILVMHSSSQMSVRTGWSAGSWCTERIQMCVSVCHVERFYKQILHLEHDSNQYCSRSEASIVTIELANVPNALTVLVPICIAFNQLFNFV